MGLRGRKQVSNFEDIKDGVVQLLSKFVRISGGATFSHKQVYHKDGWYIYKVNNKDYEVFKEKLINVIDNKDNKIVKTEKKKVKYPSDEDFGKWAWYVTSYDRAIEIVNSGR